MTLTETAAVTDRSRLLFDEARRVLPGGVNSPVRAFKSVGGTPRFIRSGSGAELVDEDGNRFVDYVGSWGPLIVGHAHPRVLSAVHEALSRGSSFGAPTAAETTLATRIIERVPGVDMVRFVNSGTEATMSAVRLARAATGRDRIIKFDGCYHGHADCFLIAAGSGALTLGEPSSPGVPRAVAADTLIARFNDADSVESLLEAHSDQVAALIVEPVGGNAGCIPPDADFLPRLRALCDQHGVVLILDEVMTGFRIAPGGAVERYGIRPDLVTFGKVIGGGFPIGAYAGARHLMERIAPSGPVYQAGTLSGNPVAVAAGIATLDLLDDAAYAHLEALGARLESGLLEVIERRGWKVVVNRVGSMFSLFFTDHPVHRVDDATAGDAARFNTFFHAMLEAGHYLAPSAYESGFLSTMHTPAHIDQFVVDAETALERAFAA